MHNPQHPATMFRDRLIGSDAIGMTRIGFDPIRRADRHPDPIDSDAACANCLLRMLGKADHPSLAVVRGDIRIDKLAAQRFEAFERAFLVRPHQPRIPRHVGGEDRGEFSFDRWDGHLAAPLDAEYSRSNRRIGMSPIGLREATPAATNAVCRRWLIARVVTPGAAGISL